jgi:hypothetical protein
MKRIRLEAKVLRKRKWSEVLPLDPRDADVRRAKALARDQANGVGQSERARPGWPADAPMAREVPVGWSLPRSVGRPVLSLGCSARGLTVRRWQP